VISVTRRYRFPAAHVLRNPSLSDFENQRIYGKCANPNGHGHDYEIEVTVAGTPDERTGFIVAPRVLDALVRERVLDRFDHRRLNDDALFSEGRVPTAENIAIACHELLAGDVAVEGARLARIRVIETSRNFFDYDGAAA
jgi:6-pyruvoyltetrahydropterin/6-carboxytetrahydropterin synthase